ncbi:hypothetical protein JET68_09215 [Pseudomonas monteilii]|nr:MULTISPECIES: hypothetical protein [Pseudomonas]MBI6918976.1 hypothetical protein [Pseudomonas monteilii]MCA4074656.1 hypothetical protein [Pseudomonas kurunegalensis]MCE0937102.1 hypothetical protein [Pseudomonas kurunegalensis]
MILNLNTVLNMEFSGDHILEENGFVATVRAIDNGDKIIFLELNPEAELSLVHTPLQSSVRLDEKYRTPKIDNRYGYNRVSGWQSLCISENYSFIYSKQYIYRELQDGDSKVLELIEEIPLVHQVDEGMLALKSSEHKSNACIILSREQLFTSEESRDSYLKMFYDELYAHNAACSTWYCAHALNTKLAESILPYTPDGYQVSVHHSSKKELLPLFRKNRDRLLYNLLYNAVFTVTQYQPKSDGLFLTTFTSSWLYRRYKLPAPYIDTRLNETFSNTYDDIIKEIPSLMTEDISFNYAEFLLKRADRGEIYRSENGMFFPDYFDLSGEIFTHTSLNHQLGIASYFLKKYDQSGHGEYLKAYHSLIAFITDTADHWINLATGDLYYEILKSPDGDWKFQSKDYTYVTLNDLLTVIKNYRSLFSKNLPEIEKLIISKLRFLDDSGFGIFDSYAPAPSGEGVMGKEVSKRLLRETGLDIYAKKDYFKEDLTHSYTYNFDIPSPLPVTRAISRLKFIEHTQGVIKFNDPIVSHWNYSLAIHDSGELLTQSSYQSTPIFKAPVTITKSCQIRVFVKDMDSNSAVANITLTPKA